MRLDSLVRLIQTADFMSFRELAFECLKLKGYREVTLTDGWSDGGTDLRVFQLPPNPNGMAFQITVEKDWKGKLHDDAVKAKSRLKLDLLVLLCSRRIAESEFEAEKDRIWREQSVQVSKIDSQSIASTFFEAKATGRVLEILGIDVQKTDCSMRTDVRTDTALAFSYFGKDANSFRELAIESAVISTVSRASPILRENLIEATRETLGLADTQAKGINSAIDRLVQRGELMSCGSALSLSEALAEATETMKRVRAVEEQELKVHLKQIFSGCVRKITDEQIASLLEHIGALMIESAKDAVALLNSDKNESILHKQVNARLRHVHSTLDEIGVAEGRARELLLEKIVDEASNSPLGKHIFAGELFMTLATTSTPQLISAFGAKTGIQVFLDASVAIPLLCTLVFSTVDNRFSISARHVYDQLAVHMQRLILPKDYLEEVATHLMRAYSDYFHLADIDPDLSVSVNSFVAHYVSMKNSGVAIDFGRFLEAFGLSSALSKADFYVARDRLMPKIQRLMDRYGISVESLGSPTPASIKRAEQAIAYAIDKLERPRPKVLTRHDARTIAYLHDRDSDSGEANVLCTWDGIHFWMREHEDAEWLVMNPAVLGDIFAIARSSDYDGHISTPLVLAKALSEEASRIGAMVLDTISKIERGSTFDAELLNQAKLFKENYVSHAHQEKSVQDIAIEWAEWKSNSC